MFSLLGGEELGGRGVITDEKVRSDEYHDCHQIFLDIVSYHAENRSGNLYDDEAPLPTAQVPYPVHFGRTKRLMLPLGTRYEYTVQTEARTPEKNRAMR